MKRAVKSFMAVAAYLLLLCCLLRTEVILLLSPAHIGMFLLGSVILCIPHLEKGISRKELGELFRENAILAGCLESFMLLFASMNRQDLHYDQILTELALDVRPMFYGFVCHEIFKGSGRKEEQAGMPWEKELPEQDETPRGKVLSVQDGEPEERQENVRAEGTVAKKAPPDLSVLTRQEREVAALVRAGLTNREIGEELCISEATVKKHMSNIFEKLRISSRKEL